MLSIQHILVSLTPSTNHTEECVFSLPAGNSPFGQAQLHGAMCGFKLSGAEPTALGVPGILRDVLTLKLGARAPGSASARVFHRRKKGEGSR